MRKVYQPSHGATGWLLSILIAVGFTAVVFCVIPFSHVVARPKHLLEIRKASIADLPPPVPEQAPPPPSEVKPDDIPPPIAPEQTAQPVPLMADLEAAVGSGGALPGFVTAPSATAADIGAGLDSVDASELGRRPEVVSQVAPAYPPELRKAKIEGTVTLVFLLTEDGRVEDARVENSSRPEFEKPALEAVRKWRFKPGLKDGQAVKTHMRLPIRFRLSS